MSDPSRARFIINSSDTKLFIAVNFDLRKHETLIKGGDPEILSNNLFNRQVKDNSPIYFDTNGNLVLDWTVIYKGQLSISWLHLRLAGCPRGVTKGMSGIVEPFNAYPAGWPENHKEKPKVNFDPIMWTCDSTS
jgi:hypothetical protein